MNTELKKIIRVMAEAVNSYRADLEKLELRVEELETEVKNLKGAVTLYGRQL